MARRQCGCRCRLLNWRSGRITVRMKGPRLPIPRPWRDEWAALVHAGAAYFMQVEAAIPVFARPWQSLLTGYSLLASSPGLVSRVWWEFRGDGPFGDSAAWVAGVLRLAFPSVKFVVWNASHSHPAVNYPAAALDRDYRLGFPFQRAWEVAATPAAAAA